MDRARSSCRRGGVHPLRVGHVVPLSRSDTRPPSFSTVPGFLLSFVLIGPIVARTGLADLVSVAGDRNQQPTTDVGSAHMARGCARLRAPTRAKLQQKLARRRTRIRASAEDVFDRSIVRETLLHVAKDAGLDDSETKEYVTQAEEELKARMHGWPPRPPKVHRDWRWLEKMAKQVEEKATNPVCLRRIYATDDEVGIIAIVERLHADRMDARGTSKELADHTYESSGEETHTHGKGGGGRSEQAEPFWTPGPEAERNGYSTTVIANEKGTSTSHLSDAGWIVRLYGDGEVPLKVHWGLTGKGEKQGLWLLPPEEARPEGSECSEDACDLDLEEDGPLRSCEITIQESSPVPGIYFVAQRVDNKKWIKASDGGDFFVPLPGWETAEERRKLESLGFFDQMPKEPSSTDTQTVSESHTSMDSVDRGSGSVGSWDLLQFPVMYEQQYQLEGGKRLLLSVRSGNKGNNEDGSVYSVELLCDVQEDGPLILHWGLAQENVDCPYELSNSTDLSECALSWQTPSEVPDNSECGGESCNTQFASVSGGTWRRATVDLKPSDGVMGIYFVLQIGHHWVSDADGNDFYVPIPSGILHQLATEAAQAPDVMHQHIFPLGRSGCSGHLLALISEHNKSYMIELFSDSPEPLVLHWGIAEVEPFGWAVPPEGIVPPGSVVLPRACETPFFVAPASLVNELHGALIDLGGSDGSTRDVGLNSGRGLANLQRACIIVPTEHKEIVGLTFVLRNEDSSKWFKDQWHNFFLTWHTNELA